MSDYCFFVLFNVGTGRRFTRSSHTTIALLYLKEQRMLLSLDDKGPFDIELDTYARMKNVWGVVLDFVEVFCVIGGKD